MNTREQMLGAVQRPPVTDDNVPTKEILKKPFASDGAVVRAFCTGCGSAFGVNRKMIENFPEFADLVRLTDEDLSDKFFQVRRCIACDTRCRDGELMSIESIA